MGFAAIRAFTLVFDGLWRLNPSYDLRLPTAGNINPSRGCGNRAARRPLLRRD
jgi:hypothetical protein